MRRYLVNMRKSNLRTKRYENSPSPLVYLIGLLVVSVINHDCLRLLTRRETNEDNVRPSTSSQDGGLSHTGSDSNTPSVQENWRQSGMIS